MLCARGEPLGAFYSRPRRVSEIEGFSIEYPTCRTRFLCLEAMFGSISTHAVRSIAQRSEICRRRRPPIAYGLSVRSIVAQQIAGRL